MIRDTYFISTLRGGVIHTILLIQAITIGLNTIKALGNTMFALNECSNHTYRLSQIHIQY